jgi:hypothetical protein
MINTFVYHHYLRFVLIKFEIPLYCKFCSNIYLWLDDGGLHEKKLSTIAEYNVAFFLHFSIYKPKQVSNFQEENIFAL